MSAEMEATSIKTAQCHTLLKLHEHDETISVKS